MKTKLYILLIGATLLSFACKRELDKPEIPNFPSGNDWSVGRILDSISSQGTFQFDTIFDKNATNAVVKGYVIADETGGNIYRTFYLRGEDGKCIAVYRKGSSEGGSEEYNVRVGDYVGISLYESIISTYNGLPQIQVQAQDPNEIIVIYNRNCYDNVKPIETDIESIKAGKHLCDLVRINDVQFDVYEGLTFAGSSTTDRTVVSCSGESVIVRTSAYASFASEPLPAGKGSLTSIVSLYAKYDQVWQLLVRTIYDVNMDAPRCGVGGEVMDLPYQQSFSNSFGTYIPFSVIGEQTWQYSSQYQCVTVTGHVVENDEHHYYENEDWLISSPIDLTNTSKVMMSVEYGAKYFSSINNEVTFWVSEDYNFGESPADATWIQLPSYIENNDFGPTTVDLVLNDFVGKLVNVAVKYISSDTQAGTIEIMSVVVKEGEPGPQVEAIFSETFAQGQGQFIIENVVLPQDLSYVWKFDSQYSCMVASAFLNSTNYETESWLISPAIDMSGCSAADLTFDHAFKFASDPQEEMSLWMSTDYQSGEPASATWVQLDIPNYPTGTNWNFYESGEIDLTPVAGIDNVRIAFKYKSSGEAAPKWEVKNVVVKSK
ncbi:MAG: DUF5689 domain-containing protein [Candidatus Limimorpha sp.]